MRRLVTWAVAALGFWILPGCSDDPDPCKLVLALTPKAPAGVDAGVLYTPRYTLDVAQGKSLRVDLGASLTGSCPGVPDGGPERYLHNRIRGFQVKVDPGQIPAGQLSGLLDYWEPVSGTPSPGGGHLIMVISARLAVELAKVIPKGVKPLVMVTVQASMTSDSKVETSPILFPIDVCNGCMSTP